MGGKMKEAKHLSNKIEQLEDSIKYLEKRIETIEVDRKIESLRNEHIDINRNSQVIKVPADFQMGRQVLLNHLCGTPAVAYTTTYTYYDGVTCQLQKGWCLMKGGEEWY